MIRHDFNALELWATILAHDPKWAEKAKNRTTKFISAGKYDEESAIWSMAKPAFIDLQHGKCAFCERKFENKRRGTIEHDLEHFRPKNAVAEWPDASKHPTLAYPFSTGSGNALGYYWLAYDILNYAACCKVCNTILKSNFFPIEGTRAGASAIYGPGQGPISLLSELPLLCYPIGEWDEDPERLITFRSTTAVPAVRHGRRHRRASVIIDFFELNDRDQLHLERAEIIGLFAPVFKKQADGDTLTGPEQMLLSKASSAALPHASCLRAHRELWQVNPAEAHDTYQHCLAYFARHV